MTTYDYDLETLDKAIQASDSGSAPWLLIAAVLAVAERLEKLVELQETIYSFHEAKS